MRSPCGSPRGCRQLPIDNLFSLLPLEEVADEDRLAEPMSGSGD